MTKSNGTTLVEASGSKLTEGPAENLPAIEPPRIPYHPGLQERFGVDRTSWKALVEAIFPNATSIGSVILALSYCKARNLDPFKRNVHIVPIWNKDKGCMVDTVWPGIGELRTTAFRTGEYAGRDDAVLGPILEEKVGNTMMEFPEWCQVTVYRIVKGQRVAFAGPKVYWLETYATRKRDDDSPNEMWANRPFGQIEKCAEAAALRAGFPEEIGTDYIPEEVGHRGGSTVPGGLAALPEGRQSFRPEAMTGTAPTTDAAREKAAAEDSKPQPQKVNTETGEVLEPGSQDPHEGETKPGEQGSLLPQTPNVGTVGDGPRRRK